MKIGNFFHNLFKSSASKTKKSSKGTERLPEKKEEEAGVQKHAGGFAIGTEGVNLREQTRSKWQQYKLQRKIKKENLRVKKLEKKTRSKATKVTHAPKEEFWGKDANCYAYALNCSKPDDAVGGAMPGMTQGVLVKPRGDLELYHRELIEAAEMDGAQHIPDSDLDHPPEHQEGTYVVALIAGNKGFHWIRRDDQTGKWSWKDGNGDTVKKNAYSVEAEGYVDIQDRTEHSLSSLVQKRDSYVPWNYKDMIFVSFFRINEEGLQVKGRGSKLQGM